MPVQGGAAANGIGRRVGTVLATIALVLLIVLLIVGVVAVLPGNIPQVTSEVGRLWLIAGAAWFFFLRGMPLAERVAQSGSSFVSLVRYVWPCASSCWC